MNVDRQTVDLSAYPELVVIYLGMRVNTLTGLKTLAGFGPKIARSVVDQPDGLLLHENLIFSLLLPMLACASTGGTLRLWSAGRGRNHIGSGGSNFCATPEGQASGTKRISNGVVSRRSMNNIPQPIGFLRFASVQPAKGGMFTARDRLSSPAQQSSRRFSQRRNCTVAALKKPDNKLCRPDQHHVSLDAE